MKKIPKNIHKETYLKSAIERGHACDAYDHKKANKAFDRMMRAAKKIRLADADGGEQFFTSLLAHDMLYVVSAAAFNLIPLNPELARKIYDELAKGPPSDVSFSAEMTLKEWGAGRLDPNWFMK